MDRRDGEQRSREEIRRLALRYCRAVDRRDFELLRSLYHPDAVEDHGGMFRGPASEFIDRLPEIMAPMEATMHFLGNMLIECDGDRAEGELYVIAVHRMRPEAGGGGSCFLTGGGRYLDHYQRREDRRWRFARRKIVADWELEIPVSQRAEALLADAARGQAGAGDASYDFLSRFQRGAP